MRESTVNLATMAILGVQTVLLVAVCWRQGQLTDAIERSRLEASQITAVLQHAIAMQPRAAQSSVTISSQSPASNPAATVVEPADRVAARKDPQPARALDSSTDRAFTEAQSTISTAISEARWRAADTANLLRSMQGLSLEQRKVLADQFHSAINEQRLEVEDIEFFPVF